MDIKQFIGCGDEWVEQKALLVLELQDMLSREEITQSEFAELVEDIARTDVAKSGAADIELAASFLKAASFIAKVI